MKSRDKEDNGDSREGALCQGRPRLVGGRRQQHGCSRGHRTDTREDQGSANTLCPNSIAPIPTPVTIARKRL